jgi:hypothetical protein
VSCRPWWDEFQGYATERAGTPYAGAVHLSLIAVVVDEYDPAIDFFVRVLGFDLVEDSPALTRSYGRFDGRFRV